MDIDKKQLAGISKRTGVGLVLLLLIAAGSAPRLQAQDLPAPARTGKQKMATRSKFYCNTKALNPAARAHHKQLSAKLLSVRQEIIETEKGYEFQFGPSNVSLAELADWVAAESKCCPFFDFHIDLEREGNLLCLRLTGEEGIKPFIRAEFRVPTC